MLPGDILLVTGEGKLSKSLVAGQKIIYSKAVSSHVELCLGDGVFIHSTGDSGVHLTLLLDEDNSSNENWRVIRHKSIAGLGTETEKLQKAAMYYYAQDYNKVFLGAGTDYSSFCSELVAKAYSGAEIEIIGGKAPSKVTPAHFDKEADALVDWIDVTEEYKQLLLDMKKNEFPYRLALKTLSAVMDRRKVNEKFREKMISKLESGTSDNKVAAEKFKELLAGRELKFWHEKKS